MDNGLNPGNRPRRAIASVLAAFAVIAVVTMASVLATSNPASAAGLEPFGSCRELSAWGADAEQRGRMEVFDSVGGDVDVAAPTASSEAGADGAGSRASATTMADSSKASGFAADEQALDATNVVVDGVDELDLVDRLSVDRVLVIAGQKLAIVDLARAEVLATRPVPYGAQITFDRTSGRAWIVGQSDDGAQVEVTRVDVGARSLDAVGTWRTSGQLVDARRIGDQLHLVAADGFYGTTGKRVPFEGDPVPCDEVLHPVGPSDPTASLIVTLPVTGELEPVHATEVVGSGQLVHVTDTAAYLATPQWDRSGGGATTTIHRFDIGTLEHTGSGSVPGTLLNDFSMSEHDGHLRVAITADGGGGFGGGRPMPVDGPDTFVVEDRSAVDSGTSGGSAGSAGSGTTVEPAAPDTVRETVPDPTVPDPSVPETTVPETTTTTEAPTTTSTSTSTTSTSTSTTSTTSTTTSTTAPEVGVTIPGPGPDDPFNRVVVLDTEGNLDVVGATPWFGHPGETLHGIRFDGDTAYAVTFLQTDPFYVLDLADPTAPRVAGEVELPGFSAYLHPVGDGKVVGFGPGETGRQEAKLFDVSNPASPKVVDGLTLGDDSPVTYDHHAFVSLGDGRFAVPVTSWMAMTTDCAIPEDVGPATDYAGCAPVDPGVDNQVVELRVVGDRLEEVDRVSVRLPEQASRALPTGDGGWAVLAGSAIGLVGADGEQGDTITV